MLATAILAGVVGACVNVPEPVAAHHDVLLVGDRIAIDTTFSVVDEGELRIELAVPLPANAIVSGAQVERGPAGVTALVLDAGHERRPSVHVEVDASEVEASGRLPLPIVCSTFVQRVRFGDDVGFRPDPRLGLVVHMGRTQPATMSSHERESIDSLLPRQRSEIGAQYVPTSAIVQQGGVIGVVERRADTKHRVALGIGAVFVVLVGGGGLAYRQVRREAQVEHADAVLAAEFDALTKDDE